MNPGTGPLTEIARQLTRALLDRSLTVTTVESCTGGLLGAAITSVPGSSGVYPGGLITYSNPLKTSMAGVDAQTLADHGAVSAQTATQMAAGGVRATHADFAIAITGIAGPDGGSEDKPVGTVWICVTGPDGAADCRRFRFPGDRGAVRQASAESAMRMLAMLLKQQAVGLPYEQERRGA